MIEIRTQFDVRWVSKRFNVDYSGFSPMAHFYEDDSPNIVYAENRYHDYCWIVGYTDKIDLTFGNHTIGGELIVLRERDNSVSTVLPSFFDLNFENNRRRELNKRKYDMAKLQKKNSRTEHNCKVKVKKKRR